MFKNIDSLLLISPSLNMGGMQRAMATLANGLAELGIEIEFYTLFNHEKFYELNSDIHHIETSGNILNKNPLTRVINIIKNIRKVIKVSKAQNVIVYGRYYSALTLIASLGLKKRIFISDRASPEYKDPFFPHLITLLIYQFCKPAGVIAQTYISADFQRKKFGSKVPIKVIPNAVRKINILNLPKENIVLAVGRFGDYLKGFDRLIEVWAQVKQKGWSLYFAGAEESEDPKLVARAKELGIYNNIKFLGKVENIDAVYSISSIFVIPSRSEGFPNALAEAMCAGLPCVSFDFKAGPRDMISQDIDGLIVSDGDYDAMAQTISFLIDNPKERLRLGSNALKKNSEYSQFNICSHLLNFIANA